MARFIFAPIAAAALLLWPAIAFTASKGTYDGHWTGDGLMGGDINECDGITSFDLDFNVAGSVVDGRFKAGHYGWINIEGTVDESGLLVLKSNFANFRGTVDVQSGSGKGKFDTAFGCGGLFDLELAR